MGNELIAEGAKSKSPCKAQSLALVATCLSVMAKGKAPVPRFGHAACSFSRGRYLAIMGGRSNSIYQDLSNIALNDLCLFNTASFEWECVALYGTIPPSRWGHGMVSLDDNKLIVFGGVNTSSYMNA